MSEALLHRVKIAAAQEGVSIKDWIEDAAEVKLALRAKRVKISKQ